MKTLTLGIAIACCALGFSAGTVLAQDSHDSHESHAAHVEGLQHIAVPEQRYATDAPLREGMHRVHEALEKLEHYPKGNLTEAMALDQVAEIKDAGAYMFANCKLPEVPDQALHAMLIPLLAAAQKFEKDPTDMHQVEEMQHAVADYPRYFDDAAWPQPAAQSTDHQGHVDHH